MTDLETTAPEIPPAPPHLPRGTLWWCLLTPLLATFATLPVTASAGTQGYALTLWYLPLVTGPVVGLICTPWFYRILHGCYRGRSLGLMTVAYPFAQLIITPSIGFGGCLLISYTM